MDGNSKKVLHTLNDIERESVNLGIIRTKLQDIIKTFLFLRIEKLKEKECLLPIKQSAEGRYSLKDIDLEREDATERVFQIYIRV